MSKYTIRAYVGLKENKRELVTYCSYPRKSPSEWLDLNCKVRMRKNAIIVPKDQFAYLTKVGDVVRATWTAGEPLWEKPGCPHPLPGVGGIVVVLESPHDDEYDDLDCKFTPLEPLMDTVSQERFENHLVRIVKAALVAKRLQLESDVQVVLCNPVQF